MNETLISTNYVHIVHGISLKVHSTTFYDPSRINAQRAVYNPP